MPLPVLHIGNKNYSSWSLRPWLLMQVLGIAFEEHLIPLFDENWDGEIAKVSPSRKVPCLTDGDVTVWETMAIVEYLHEHHPGAGVWPANPRARAMARCAANEMHGGFGGLRSAMPMNVRKSLPGRGRTEAAIKDIARIETLWSDCRKAHGTGGPFLFGAFCAADAMFAPVVSRFVTYGVALEAANQAYVDAVMALPAMEAWVEAGRGEPWVLPHDEVD
ncbi:MAG: glutathione S-transferase family protein [Proteobacteria bacterium]|nr:glutathione S-transferase family protein [Pseudomonadota bacterium]MDA0951374.1 glutathione S-transferase family protein [Pseudomonadota bacterium]MDA1071415.1 glutathione S-transferase family protein [Pseudomonadota bacterium]